VDLGLEGNIGDPLGLVALAWMAAISGWLGTSVWNATFQVTDAGVLAAIILLLGAYAFLDGAFAVGLGVQNFGEGRRWWVLIVEGLLSIGLGLFTLGRTEPVRTFSSLLDCPMGHGHGNIGDHPGVSSTRLPREEKTFSLSLESHL